VVLSGAVALLVLSVSKGIKMQFVVILGLEAPYHISGMNKSSGPVASQILRSFFDPFSLNLGLLSVEPPTESDLRSLTIKIQFLPIVDPISVTAFFFL